MPCNFSHEAHYGIGGRNFFRADFYAAVNLIAYHTPFLISILFNIASVSEFRVSA